MNKHAVCVRVDTTRRPDATAAKLLARVPLKVQPALVVITPDGDVAHIQYARLYPAYFGNRVEMSSWSEALWGSREILAMLRDARARIAAEDATLAALRARSDLTARTEEARILKRRGRSAEARALLETALETSRGANAARASTAEAGTIDARLLLAELYAEAGHGAKGEALRAEVLAHHGSDPRAETWAFELAAARIHRRTSDAEATDTLNRLAEKAEDPALRVRSRLALGHAAHERADLTGLKGQLAQLFPLLDAEGACAPGWSSAMLFSLAHLAQLAGEDYETRAATYAALVARCHPDSIEAQIVKHGMLDTYAQACATR